MNGVGRAACYRWIVLWRHAYVDIRGHGIRAIRNIEGKVHVAIEVFVWREAVSAVTVVG